MSRGEYECDACLETFVDDPGLGEVGHDQKEDGTECYGIGTEQGEWFASHADMVASIKYDRDEDAIREAMYEVESQIDPDPDWSIF